MMFFVSWNEHAPMSPIVPTGRPWYVTPIACAASSSTGCRRVPSVEQLVHRARDVLEVHGHDRGRARRDLAPRHRPGRASSESSTSANTGTAPALTTAPIVAMNVNAGTMTSSPHPTPSAASAHRNAAVPLDVASANAQPNASHAAASNAATRDGVRGPW